MTVFGGNVAISFYYVKPLINPGNIDYLDYEINDENFIAFDSQYGGTSSVYI